MKIPTIETLFKITGVLEESNLGYWLDGGTLLGITRNGTLIPGDTDLDLGIYSIEWAQNQALFERALAEAGMTFNTTNSRKAGISYSPNGKLEWIDLWKFNYRQRKYGDGLGEYYHQAWGGTFTWPEQHLKTLDKIVLLDHVLYVPHDPEGYLTVLYGPDWHTPKKLCKPRDYANWKKNVY